LITLRTVESYSKLFLVLIGNDVVFETTGLLSLRKMSCLAGFMLLGGPICESAARLIAVIAMDFSFLAV
jgi:hypothetical protein